MRIDCDACSAKYSLPDEKVHGRTIKIRCKRCGHVITARGAPAEAPLAALDAPAPPPDDAPWHVVIDQEQVGPMTAAEVQQRFAAGQIDADTYAWREGLADWQPVATLAELAGPLGLAPAAAAIDAPPPSAPDAGPASAARLHGERNESSVLFTLGNLAQLASPARAPAAASAAAPGAAGEGSGLIDIRSMASAYLGDRAPRPAAAVGIGSIDDLPVFAAAAFAEPAVAMPAGRRDPRARLVPVLIALVCALAIVAVALIVMLARRPAATPASAPIARATVPVDPDGPRTDATATTPAPTAPMTPPAPAPEPSVPAPPPSTDPPPVPAPPTDGPRRPRTPSRTPQRTDRTDPTPSPTATPGPGHDRQTCDQVTCMMNDYKDPCCAPFRPEASRRQPPAVDPDRAGRPESLDVGAVRTGMRAVHARIVACGSRSSARGEVKVGVKVSPDGAVTSTVVKKTPDAALGACVAAAIEKATFGKTQKGGAFAYPQTF